LISEASPLKYSLSKSSLNLDLFLFIYKKTQYIFFYINKEEKKTFSRLVKMINYVESYLYRELRPTVAYRHLIYEAAGLVLKTVNEFKYYMKVIYGITLRDL